MLKRGVMLLFFILSISTFSMVTHAANSSEYVNQSFYGYKEPSFTSAKTNGGSEYGAQNVGVVEKRDNGWWKIETWEGPVWINLNGEERVMGDFYAYDEPSFSSKVANAGAKYGRQTFRIVDGTTDGWLKFKTWEGDKWMNPTSEQITVNKTIYAYNEPSFNATKANYGAPYNPQNWGVVEKKENGWMKVGTYEGYKWINPDGEERFINKSFYAYNEASFNAAKANAGALYNPQNFRVVDGTPSGWLKVKTWEGEKWLNLDGEERFINQSFYAYNEPSFSSGKANAGALYSPQNFRVIDGTTSGWLKIKTWEGDKWVNLSAEDTGIEFYVEATAYSVEGSPPHERITAFGIDIGKNPNIKLIAVDPKVIKLGTKVHVEGYGDAIAGDTGGAIKGNKIDVLFPTEKQAREWGRKKVKIKIMK
ncbi:3D domain-containing protein [Bacillus thuringiensis]|uniref:3D domain-containing protein n=2 Tax=Bacillus thuringiensis TaxID=1428 RepID=A0ABD6R5K4_BACTU|nr:MULTISPECIES: 3D domain-containing protein [Bacillus cereus group]MCU4808102.1 3D domain-containing protein [Bacillus cereus]MCU5087322.1 3D domain-containing protein [Bacillus cereus]MCU5103318.1 3D domain-containing protein [Bacillus cereus]MCU5143908.1 3D domain-containing protein [Bacillus cereus]MEC2710041.1 3D domain-containing protein [Bacillus thuringiensis]